MVKSPIDKEDDNDEEDMSNCKVDSDVSILSSMLSLLFICNFPFVYMCVSPTFQQHLPYVGLIFLYCCTVPQLLYIIYCSVFQNFYYCCTVPQLLYIIYCSVFQNFYYCCTVPQLLYIIYCSVFQVFYYCCTVPQLLYIIYCSVFQVFCNCCNLSINLCLIS